MKFEKSIIPLNYIGIGLLINDNVAIYDTNKRTIVSILLFKWCLNITIVRPIKLKTKENKK